ncbi:MAG TPA: ABC transporter permease [Gaiellaceae bacterium]
MSTALPVVVQPSEAQVARRERLGQLVRSKTFLIGLFIVCFWIFWAIVGERLTPHDPLEQTPDILARPFGKYWFGTDSLGRDVFSRVLAGARNVLAVAPLATLLGVVCGTALGLITGYFRGAVDDVISRVIEAVLALPLIVVAVTALVALGQSTVTLIIVIGAIFTPLVARTVRAAVLAERDLDYVKAALLRRESSAYVLFVEILPNVMPPIIVEATVRLGYAIFTVAGLTFLGFGPQPPSPDWAAQINASYQLLAGGSYWWTVLFPALAIATLVVAVNLIADGLQQVLDQ